MSCKHIDIAGLTIDCTGPRPRRLVDDLTLTIPGGEVVALVGESGAGKSMTSLAVMGLLPRGIRQTAGSVTVNHSRLTVPGSEEWRRMRNRQVAMILQNPMSAFDPIFRIRDHFHETLRSHGMAESKKESAGLALQALRDVGFDNPEPVLGIYPFQMSGGMLQRVMIALALITDPDFLIADEATTDLDAPLQAKILDLLREKKRERHLGMLVITHDLAVAACMADTVAVMHRGRLVERGPVREIFRSPCHAYTRELLAAHRSLYTGGPGRLPGTAVREAV